MIDERGRFETAIDEALDASSVGNLAAARLVYADWLDEQNTEADGRLAAAQRWMAAKRRRASKVRWGVLHWCWYVGPDGLPSDVSWSLLPLEVWDRLPGGQPDDGWKHYPTRVAAESALAEALTAMEDKI